MEERPDDVIYVKDLSKSFGNALAVQNLSFRVKRGTVFGLLGKNGSGKSTTAKLLTGLLKPDSGAVFINGCDIGSNLIGVQKSIGILSDEMALIDVLTIWEHLLLASGAYDVSTCEAEARSKKLLRYFDLWDDRHKYPDQLSVGMYKKTSLAMSLVHNPKILFLDEPFEGMDPISIKRICEIIEQLVNRGVTIFLASHFLALMQNLLNAFVIIDGGKMVYNSDFQDSPKDNSSLEDIFFSFIKTRASTELEWIG